jgi:DNA-directed RNA polymerase subunit RPC12/RpoP
MDSRNTKSCPTCGHRMIFRNAIPSVASLPALRTYKCEDCGVRLTETEEQPVRSHVIILPVQSSFGSRQNHDPARHTPSWIDSLPFALFIITVLAASILAIGAY